MAARWDARPCPDAGTTIRSVEKEFNYSERTVLLRSELGIALPGLIAVGVLPSAAGRQARISRSRVYQIGPSGSSVQVNGEGGAR
jgi:hypothetical protein